MLRDCRDKLQRRKGLEIALVTSVAHLRTIDYNSGFLNKGEFSQRKGIADYVLGKIFNALGIACLNTHLNDICIFDLCTAQPDRAHMECG
jgi:hypothetical protein